MQFAPVHQRNYLLHKDSSSDTAGRLIICKRILSTGPKVLLKRLQSSCKSLLFEAKNEFSGKNLKPHSYESAYTSPCFAFDIAPSSFSEIIDPEKYGSKNHRGNSYPLNVPPYHT
jgi:hypothetical protein